MLKVKNKNKIVISVVLLAFAVTALIGYFVSTQNPNYTYKQLYADREQLASSFEELEIESDLIIRATVLPDKQIINNILPDGSYGFGYTLTNLQVTEVYKGEKNVDDVIIITEEYFIRPNEPTVIRTQEGYMPAKEGTEYIFFLKAYPLDDEAFPGMYFPVDLEFGKYPTSLNAGVLRNRSGVSLDSLQITSGTTSKERYIDWANQVNANYSTWRGNE